ncbi:MAG: 30S ribosomal protein S15 [Candidatus Diapherotrites archaeon]
MALMDSKKDVKSKNKIEWVEYTDNQIKQLVVASYNQGKTPAEIGTTLRDLYGIPSVKKVTGKKIQEILKESKLLGGIPQDLLNLIKRSVKLTKHMKENKKDMTSKRGYQLTVSKIRRLVRYYHKTGTLPREWMYTPEKAELLVK